MSLALDELLSRFRGLITAYRGARDPLHGGEGNLRCEACLDCTRCRFCSQCIRCDDCGNCESCEDCVRCTRSRGARRCRDCNYVEFSESCEDSQYLVLCLDCSKCEQCFACVGLRGESFCVLNQRYSRKEYFQVVQALKKRLEEQMETLLPELILASRGRWGGGGSGSRVVFVQDGSTGVKGVIDGSDAPVAEAAVEDDPWMEGVVATRVDESAPALPDATARISRVPPT